MRVLITGSRYLTDSHRVDQAIVRAVSHSDEDVTIIHGNAPGADTLAGKVATRLGYKVEVYPADWGTHGKAAGPMRNQQMVDSGADICLAFPEQGSRGTWDCVRRAEKASIPVEVHS